MITSDKFSKTYSSFLKYIDGYGIIEIYNNNNVIVAYKAKEEDNYKLNENGVYITFTHKPIIESFDCPQTLGFIIREANIFFQKQFMAKFDFYLAEKINNSYRIYFFKSMRHVIYDGLLNNLELIKRFISFFKEHNKHIIDKYAKIKKDFENYKKKLFREPYNLRCYSEKENLLNILKLINPSNNKAVLTREDWTFISAYNYGKIHNVDMSHIFNFSKDEMESKFNKISHNLIKEHRLSH